MSRERMWRKWVRVMTVPNPNDGFPCDELLESQWLDRVMPCFTDVPERRLLVAVLVDSIRCLALGGRQRTEVVAWLRGATARISFRSLCEGLDVEAAPLARRLLLTANHTAKAHRRVGVRQMYDGGMRIVVVEPHVRQAVVAGRGLQSGAQGAGGTYSSIAFRNDLPADVRTD